MDRADPTAVDPAAAQRTAIVVAWLCLLLVGKIADAVAVGVPSQALFVAALFVLPVMCVVPARL